MDREIIGRLLKRDIARIAQMGAVTGSVAGFAGLLAGADNSAVAGATAAGWTWLLVATLPLGLVLVTALELRRSGGAAYSATNGLALARILLTIGLVGGLAGAVLEFVVASYIPTLFSFWRLDAAAVRASLIGAYPWIAIPCALGAVAAVAIVGVMAFRALRTSRD